MYIYAPHEPMADRLVEVIAEMRELRSPTIMAYWAGDHWRALEGSHHLAAAHALGLTPVVEQMDLDDEIERDFEDISGSTVRDALAYLDVLGPDYEFDDLAGPSL